MERVSVDNARDYVIRTSRVLYFVEKTVVDMEYEMEKSDEKHANQDTRNTAGCVYS